MFSARKSLNNKRTTQQAVNLWLSLTTIVDSASKSQKPSKSLSSEGKTIENKTFPSISLSVARIVPRLERRAEPSPGYENVVNYCWIPIINKTCFRSWLNMQSITMTQKCFRWSGIFVIKMWPVPSPMHLNVDFGNAQSGAQNKQTRKLHKHRTVKDLPGRKHRWTVLFLSILSPQRYCCEMYPAAIMCGLKTIFLPLQSEYNKNC